ncbi:MAG: EAL domain-containing protein [Gallionella sp.]
MAHRPYRYLQLMLVLRNSLLLNAHEYTLTDTPQDGLICEFMGMRLRSVFQAVHHADGTLVGHEALLRATRLDQEIAPEAAFDYALNANRVVQFDRLVRTIHLLNHARHYPETARLFLNVHPYFVSQVGDHGRTFEKILHYHELETSHIVIEMQPSEEVASLAAALNNYRALGYSTALDNVDDSHFHHALLLKPDMVKLDRQWIDDATQSDLAIEGLAARIDALHQAGIRVVVQGIETADQLALAQTMGAEYVQGLYVGCAELNA